MKKEFLIFVCSLAFLTSTNAQVTRELFLLKGFSQGIILNKDGSKAAAEMNYDAKGRNMLFLEGEDLMLLTNTNAIDTIFIGSRKFIPEKNYFLEVVGIPNGTVYVDWRFNSIQIGKKGAYGITTQGTVETVNVHSYRAGGKFEWDESTAVTKFKVENEYRVKNTAGKILKFKNKKDLLKQFANHKEAIEQYLAQNSVDWENPEMVVDLADFCLGLLK